MAISFPEVDDVHLANAPLREVICQVRFPIILSIAREEPAEFQDRIRERFPVLEIERGFAIQMKGTQPEPRIDARPSIYSFHDPGKTCSASLGPDFYALSTTAYNRWQDFSENLAYLSKAVQDLYQIPYATRIGLRYINSLDPTSTQSGEFQDVLGLLRPELTVMLRTDVIGLPETSIHRIHSLSGNDRLTLTSGLVREGDPPQPQFRLDLDHYIEGNIKLDDLLSRCHRYHQQIYHAFRWCLAPNALPAFGPELAGQGE